MAEPERLKWGETNVVVGLGCLDNIAADLRTRIDGDPSPVVIFSGRKAMREHGFLAALVGRFAPRRVEVYEHIAPDPTLDSCQRAADFLTKLRPSCLVALGGGSVIDTAKAANIAAGTQSPVRELLQTATRRELRNLTDNFVAVPTTAGTGSEVTPFATVWDFEASKKYSIDNRLLQPSHAYLDGLLAVSLSESQTQTAAGDALAHALESIWSKSNHIFTQALAAQAVRLIVKTLPTLLADLSAVEARQRMSWASLLAGMAISRTRTAAAHAISYPLTLGYGVPHGRAVAVLLPHVLAANLTALGDERVELLCDCFAVGTREELPAACQEFLTLTGITQPLSSYGVRPSDVPGIARESNTPGRLDNNCQPLSVENIERIISDAL
ncbi:MAG TPA: phosphonoacetaldehyde reductase [Pyrinomonadaceae bacterium]